MSIGIFIGLLVTFILLAFGILLLISDKKTTKQLAVLNKILGTIIVIMIIALCSVLFLNLSTFTHEYVGHALVAKLLGCEAQSNVNYFVGATHYECPTSWTGVNIIIGLSSIFVVFFIALGIWLWFGENSIARVVAIIMMFYSVIPSAFPLLPGSDMAFVIEHEFPLILAWFLWFMLTGIFGWLLVNEVTDKPYFQNWFKEES